MKETKIQWTDATVNFWTGCHKISEGCKFCYMYRDKERYGQDPTKVMRTKEPTFYQALKWEEPRKIFTNSWSDFFIEEADEWRADAWEVIRKTPQHQWQILTKRPERIKECLPKDWGEGWDNVWLGVSIENQKNFHRAITLSEIPAKIRFISAEPLLEELDLLQTHQDKNVMDNFQWCIIGGESGNETGKYRYRECEQDWIEKIMADLKNTGVKVFVKQLGTSLAKGMKLKDRHGGDIEEWPEHLRMREFPEINKQQELPDSLTSLSEDNEHSIKQIKAGITKNKKKYMKSEFKPIDDVIESVKTLPKENFFYEGIKEHSLNFLISIAKIGKTTCAENMGMCVAAGYDTYLGKKVWAGDNKRVLICSLEEYYRGRTERNIHQMEYMDSLVGHKDWHSNVFVSPADGLRYIESQKDWDWIMHQIKEVNPAFTVIDSLSRMHGVESIEDSSTCIGLMKKLKNIVDKTGTTLLVIHHTSKIGNEPLTLSNMAGSRILAQEADAIIALNKTPTDKRYIKPLAYRYADDSCDTVQLFNRDKKSHWLLPAGNVQEYKILREFDNRINDTNSETVMDYVLEYTAGDKSILIESSKMMEAFVNTYIMSKPTLYKSIAKLVEEGLLIKQQKGRYSLPKSNE